MIVNVIPKDILLARPGGWCPVHQALKRILGADYGITATYAAIVITHQKEDRTVKISNCITPSNVADFMWAFDTRKSVAPISFELEIEI